MRPELVVKIGHAPRGAPAATRNATTMLCRAGASCAARSARTARAAARLSLAFLRRLRAGRRAADDAPALASCTAAASVRRGRHGAATTGAADVTVDPRTHEVRVDGEPVGVEPVEEVALSWRYLLG